VALSQDEQRMLAEIERRLSAEDPRLASRLSSFRRPGPGGTFRTPRGRIVGSLFAVALVAVVSMMVYAMVPFHAHGAKSTYSPQASTSAVSSHYAPPSAASNSSAAARTGAGVKTAKTSPNATTKSTAGQSGTRTLSAKAPSARATNPSPATAG
jgi:cytoskeletal protein RodZ